MKEFTIRVGKPTHLKLSDGSTACGLVGAQYAAYDPRDVDCERCRRTVVYRKAMGVCAK